MLKGLAPKPPLRSPPTHQPRAVMAGAATHRSHGENPASEASQPEASTQRDLAASEGATRASAPLKSNPSIPVTVRSDGLRECIWGCVRRHACCCGADLNAVLQAWPAEG